MKKSAAILSGSIVLMVVAFWPGLGGSFLADDYRMLVEVRDGAYGSALHDFTDFGATFYRPMARLHDRALWGLFGDNPTPWSVVAVATFAAIVVLVYFTLRRLRFDATSSSVGALVFALHPIHAETLVWMAARPDRLAALFALLLLLAAGSLSVRGIARVVASSILLLLGLLSKANAIAVLPVLVLMDVVESSDARSALRVHFRKTWPLWATGFLFLMVHGLSLRDVPSGGYAIAPGVQTLANFVFALSACLIPVDFQPLADLGLSAPSVGVLVFAVVVSLAVWVLASWRSRWGRVALLWAVAAFLPMSVFAGSGERFLVLPSISVGILIAALASGRLLRRRAAAWAAVFVCVAAFFAGSRARANDWARARDQMTGLEIELARVISEAPEGSVIVVDSPRRVGTAWFLSNFVKHMARFRWPDANRIVIGPSAATSMGGTWVRWDGERLVDVPLEERRPGATR